MNFETVKKSLWEQKGLCLTKNVDARHNGKYTYSHTPGGGNAAISFKNLKEVVEHFDLTL